MLTMMFFPTRDTGSGDGKGGRGLPGAIWEALRREAAAELDMVVGGKNGYGEPIFHAGKYVRDSYCRSGVQI